MKRIFLLFAYFFIITACSRKTVPSKTNETVETNTDTVATSPVVTSSVFMIVSDGFGRIITSQKNLPPDANVKFDYLQLSKGFTPQQQANLKARYKTIPPRVLYISPQYELSSARGAYYIYRKKFWYWKRKDGLFYLDPKYYM
jgi:hypothetical protein